MAGKASGAATVSSVESEEQLAPGSSSLPMFGRDTHLPLNQSSSSSNSTGKKNEKRTDDIHHPNNQLNHNNNTCQSSSSSSQKRPMNAFLIFCKRHRSVVKSKYPHLENRSITKILGEWWAALDADQKQTYTELARQYKEAFMKANPHFKWYKTDSFLSAPPKQSSLPSQSPVMIMSSSSPSKSSNGQQAVMNEEKKAVDDVKTSEEGSLKENKSNPTPKPPKKRYLETNEFKSTMKNNSSPAAASTAASIPTPPSIQPVLDTETMSRVIVDALTAGPNPPPSSYLNMNSIKTAAGVALDSPSRSPSSPERMKGSPSPSSHHPVMNGQSPPRHAVNGIHSPPLVSKESVSSLTAESLLIAESQQPIGSATALIASANKSNSSCNSSSSIANSHTNTSGLVSVSASISVPMEEDDEDDDDDKPLNLSSSKVLRASNQQIIDHFIDKLLTTGGECGEGNPMPVEMMEHTSSMNIVKQDTRMSSNCVNGGGSVSASKRPKSNSASSGHSSSSSGDSETGNNQNKSKWVSGEFDLEERIAALPQLQDTHLINALNHKSGGLIAMNNGVNSRPTNDLNGADIDMEVGPCDGLKALAEVALSQANAISTSSAS